MSSTSGPSHLSGHHRDTLLQIFQEPTGHNVEWHDVMSLQGAIGSIEQRHDDMFVFRIGEDTEVPPKPAQAVGSLPHGPASPPVLLVLVSE